MSTKTNKDNGKSYKVDDEIKLERKIKKRKKRRTIKNELKNYYT